MRLAGTNILVYVVDTPQEDRRKRHGAAVAVQGHRNVVAPLRHKPSEMPNCQYLHETVNSHAPVTHSDNPAITRVDMVQQRVKCFIALLASWRDGVGRGRNVLQPRA